MPRFTFTAPDGTPVVIKAPEGSTRQDAADLLRRLTATEEGTQRLIQMARREKTIRPWVKQVPGGRTVASTVAGVAEPMGRAALGAQELIHAAAGAPPGAREASTEDVTNVRATAAGLPPAGRFVANIAGEAAQLMSPARAGRGLAQAAGRRIPSLVQGPSRQWITPLTGEAAGMAAFRGAATPGTPEQRLAAAGSDFTAGMTGGAIGRGLEKAVRGIRKTPEAESLLQKGAELTPGHAGAHGFWPGLESRMSYVWGLAGPTGRLQVKSLDTWNRAILREAVKSARGARPDKVTRGGYDGTQEAAKELGRAYDSTYGRVSDPDDLKSLYTKALSIQARLMDDIQRSMSSDDQRRALVDIGDSVADFRKNLTPEGVQEFRQDLKDIFAEYATKMRRRAAPVRIHKRALDAWDNALDEVSPGIVDDLKGLDRAYAQVMAMKEAANRTEAYMRGMWSPRELIAATKESRDLLKQQLYEGKESIGAMLGKENIFGQLMIGGGGLGLLTRDIGQAAATAGTTIALGKGLVNEPMRKTFLGLTNWQQAGQRALTDRRAQMFRSAMARAAAAAPEEY